MRVQDGVAEAYVFEVYAVRGGLSPEGEGEVVSEVVTVDRGGCHRGTDGSNGGGREAGTRTG